MGTLKVFVRPMFGAQCFFALNGRMFAFRLRDGSLVLRLPAEEYEASLGRGCVPFMLRPNVPFGRWVRLSREMASEQVEALWKAAYNDALSYGPGPTTRKGGHRLRPSDFLEVEP